MALLPENLGYSVGDFGVETEWLGRLYLSKKLLRILHVAPHVLAIRLLHLLLVVNHLRQQLLVLPDQHGLGLLFHLVVGVVLHHLDLVVAVELFD